MAKSGVSIVKGTDPETMVEKALALLGGVESLIKPDSVVVIKPNAGHYFAPETSVCTNPEVVAAVIKAVRKAKPKEVIVAESAAIGHDTMKCFEISGIGKAAEEAGADRIVDLKSDKDLVKVPIRDARSDLTSILLPKFFVEADHLINVPIFKSHVSMVFTNALKNWKGVVQDRVHYLMHQTDLAAAMMDIWSVCRADLTVADMIHPGEGYGPHNAIPIDFGCIVTGRDPVAVDATCCRMVGLDINKVAYFKAVRDRGLGNFNENSIEIRGNSIKEVFKQMWLPYLEGFDKWPEYHIYADGACSSCQSLLAFTMEKLRAVGEYDKNAGLTIVVGKTKELPKGVDPKNLILFGDCLKKFRGQGIAATGCPPLEAPPFAAIVMRKDISSLEDIGLQKPEIMEQWRKYDKLFQNYMKQKREKWAASL